MTKATTQARAFTLTIEPTLTDDYGIRLEVATRNPEHPRQTIAHVLPANVSGVADPLLQALRESGQPRTILSASRRKPIPLVEPAGVRLALALLAADPVNKHGRAQRRRTTGTPRPPAPTPTAPAAHSAFCSPTTAAPALPLRTTR